MSGGAAGINADFDTFEREAECEAHRPNGQNGAAHRSSAEHEAERRFAVITAKDCRTILGGREAIKGVLPSKGMAVIYGEPGCGKTFSSIAMLV